MLRIYLARHGQDEDNENGLLNWHRDKPLTNIGTEQARSLATTIKDSALSFDGIYSSPLQRAYKTASIIAEALDADYPEKIDLLIERDFWELTGIKISDAIKFSQTDILPTSKVTYILHPKDGEDFPTLLKRGGKIVEFIESKHKDGNVLLVAHGDIGKMIYAAYYKIDRKEVLQSFHFWNAELILLAPNTKPSETHIFKTEQHNL